MNYFFKILRFGLPYKQYAFLNIFFNILYALFSALAYVAMIPMMQILFDTTERNMQRPTYQGIGEIKLFLQDFFNYKISQYLEQDSGKALFFVISTIIGLFFLKKAKLLQALRRRSRGLNRRDSSSDSHSSPRAPAA